MAVKEDEGRKNISEFMHDWRDLETAIDRDNFTIIESDLPTADRYATCPADFVQKGFPRKDRIHLDLPARPAYVQSQADFLNKLGEYNTNIAALITIIQTINLLQSGNIRYIN